MSDRFGLYLILTEPVAGYGACAHAAVAQGVRYLQLRIKDRPRHYILDVARQLRSITLGSGTRFILNDDVALAAEVDADGVHLGQGDMPLLQAREIWNRPGKTFGWSTHSESQEDQARALAPDYIGVGPVFRTPTKKIPDPELGVQRAAAIIRNSPLTTVAIGGIDSSNLPDLLRAGIHNFAVVRAVNLSPTPAAAIAQLIELWNRCQVPSP
jgi:thiamine-phosphate pyrophosphorylase